MEEGEEDQGAAWYVFMVNLIMKLNTRTKKTTTWTVLSDVDTQRQKTTTHTHSGKTGYLSMVLNQRQRMPAASDWEPYEA